MLKNQGRDKKPYAKIESKQIVSISKLPTKMFDFTILDHKINSRKKYGGDSANKARGK